MVKCEPRNLEPETFVLNYFSYFSEIEDTFIRRRGKHLWLSPLDWALMESWKERGVPLHVALRGIEHAFDSHEAKKHKRSVKTLLYCEEEVEAQYAEWLESRVGSHDAAQKAQEGDQESPFPRQAVLEHLETSLDQLNQQRRKTSKEELGEVLSRAAKQTRGEQAGRLFFIFPRRTSNGRDYN